MVCNIIPRYILKNIAEKTDNDKQKSAYKNALNIVDNVEHNYRIKRKKIIEQGIKPELIHDHVERLIVYNNKYEWDYIKDHLWEDFKQNHVSEPKKLARRIFTKNLDQVHDLFHDLLGRESFDNENAAIQAWIKFGQLYPNAYWDGEFLAFGSGDKYYFNDFAGLPDVIAHEIGHAVTQYECNLIYESQPGALNEHISDVFGICFYQKKYLQTVANSKWLIGPGIFTNRVNGTALRSFKNEMSYNDPVVGRDEQPKYMKDYKDLPVTEDGDWGGVHLNSGIPNHAFYLFNLKLGGKTWENNSLKIWYYSMLKKYGLPANASFEQFAAKTLEIAEMLDEDLVTPLAKSWQEVGVV